MKIAISSCGQSLDSQIDQRFGRAAYFIIVDTESMDFFTVDNNNTTSGGGAGIGSAKTLIDLKVFAVLTGNCGPNAQLALSSANVRLYTNVSGTVSDAFELFKTGKLSQAAQSNVKAHFGMGSTIG